MKKYIACSISLLSVAFLAMAQEAPPLLTPSIYIYGVYGSSSADNPQEFAPGGHDPDRSEAFILQAFEPSLSLRWGEYIEGFANGTAFTDSDDNVEWEWEEYFLKLVNLPGGLEVRGGRMLSRVGFHNPIHLHSWSTVDAPLPHALFLGEDGLGLEGADVSLFLGASKRSVITLGFGKRPPHDEDAHGEEEEHEEEGGHDDEHEEGHSGIEAFEEYRVVDDVFTIGFRNDMVFNDFRSVRSNLFGGFGDNEVGQSSWFAGAGVEMQWRENGLEPGGRALRWRNEIIFFDGGSTGGHDDEDEHDEEEEEHHEDEVEESGMDVDTWGFTSEIVYEAHPHAHPFARIDYIADTEALEVADWIRYTVGLTIPLAQDPGVYLRVQGNADERGDESEQAIWAQLGFKWGGPEVR